MKKNASFIVLLAALLAFAPQTMAHDGYVNLSGGNTIYYTFDSIGQTISICAPNYLPSGSASWSGYTRPSGLLVIPDSIVHEGFAYPVVAIDTESFFGCDGIVSVTIPSTVTSIKKLAFGMCMRMTSINIPSSVTRIEDYSFSGCAGLSTIMIPNSVTSIGQLAFESCTHLTTITIPSSVTFIGACAFSKCVRLTEAIIQASVTRISPQMFMGCTNLSSVYIPSTVNNIANSAFQNCVNLEKIVSKATIAPQLHNTAFYGVPANAKVIIPCGSQPSYSSLWNYFSNFIEEMDISFSATSSDAAMGTVEIQAMPTCTDSLAVVNAVANTGYSFDHWSDGSTMNPYTLSVTQDTSIVAYFIPNNGIGDIEVSDANIYQHNGRIVVECKEPQSVTLYDAFGRRLETSLVGGTGMCQFELPTSGVYFVKIGDQPAHKVIVIR